MKIYCIAGEASGDLHGKNLLRAWNRILPGTEFRGVGGDGMQAQGMYLVRHIRDTAFMGFSDVLRHLGTIRNLFRDVKADILQFRPDAVILIDYPGFNLRMARWLKQQGIRVVYYISPKVWAWKKSRVKTIRRCVDKLFLILPFEQAFFAKEGVVGEFVGHPLLDEMMQYRFDDAAFTLRNSLSGKPILALLPGSRRQEISRMLPVMLEAAASFPSHQPVICGAPGVDPDFYSSFLSQQGAKLVFGQTYEVLHAAEVAIVTSGTATLEAALFRVPQVVCYAANALSVMLARRLIRVRFISLVNLILGREAVREFIQQDLTPENLVRELQDLSAGPGRDRMMKDYAELHGLLGGPGASEHVVTGVLKLCGIQA